MHQILALFSLWTLFSIELFGMALYIPYIAIPAILFKSRESHKFLVYPKYLIVILVLIPLFFLIPLITKLYLFKDIIKIILMFLYFIYLRNFIGKKNIFKIIDLSILILVIYGLLQYIAFLMGYQHYGSWLHSQMEVFHPEISQLGLGGAYSMREGFLRVSSLTYEPSFFAFTTGVYFFITKNPLIKALCLLGGWLSFSLISLYSVLGLIIFYVIKLLFKRVNLLLYMIAIFIVQIIFVIVYYSNISGYILNTFAARYTGLSEFIESTNAVELMTGLYDTSGSIWIKSPMSNLSSIVVNFGIIGVLLYIYFLSKLGKKNEMAALSIYLYGFNFYYITAWPSFVVFIYMIYIDGKSTNLRNPTLFQFRKDHFASSQLNQKTNLSSSRNNLHR